MNHRVAVIQTNTQKDIQHNLQQVEQSIAIAAQNGAKLVVLPEMFLTLDQEKFSHIAKEKSYKERIASWGKKHQMWIVAGAIPVAAESGKFYSVCSVFNENGTEVASYKKIHLFDAEISDKKGRYRESDIFEAGNELVVVDTPVGKVGLAICYDLRFPELFAQLRLKGAEIICIPSAFTYTTGKAHWQPLLRARAIEQQCYVLAADQCGWYDESRQTWGHSQIISPWGVVLDSLEESPGVAISTIDLSKLNDIRQQMPLLQHKRL